MNTPMNTAHSTPETTELDDLLFQAYRLSARAALVMANLHRLHARAIPVNSMLSQFQLMGVMSLVCKMSEMRVLDPSLRWADCIIELRYHHSYYSRLIASLTTDAIAQICDALDEQGDP